MWDFEKGIMHAVFRTVIELIALSAIKLVWDYLKQRRLLSKEMEEKRVASFYADPNKLFGFMHNGYYRMACATALAILGYQMCGELGDIGQAARPLLLTFWAAGICHIGMSVLTIKQKVDKYQP